jgi:hypothetical protein
VKRQLNCTAERSKSKFEEHNGATFLAASDEGIKNFVRRWVALLAEQNYVEAAAMFSNEVIPANGSINVKEHSRWTPQLLEAVINNYGLEEPVELRVTNTRLFPLCFLTTTPWSSRLRRNLEYTVKVLTSLDRSMWELFLSICTGGTRI